MGVFVAQKWEQDLAERQPAMESIVETCQQRLHDSEMAIETSQPLQKHLEKLRKMYATTVGTVKVGSAASQSGVLVSVQTDQDRILYLPI